MAETGPGEDEPEIADKVLPLRPPRSVLLVSSGIKYRTSMRANRGDNIIVI